MSIIDTLTEGIVNRDMAKEGQALLDKWSATGLLEGIESNHAQHTMARLLENQARELLREANSMEGGNVEGFAAVAFPIVRRVFAGLIANDLVSVQPMSLPSGLIFFLDFTFDRARGTVTAGNSIYGQGVVGSQVTGGVDLATAGVMDSQPYGFASSYSSATGSATITDIASGQEVDYWDGTTAVSDDTVVDGTLALSAALAKSEGENLKKALMFDVDVLQDTDAYYKLATIAKSEIAEIDDQFSKEMLQSITFPSLSAGTLVRRLTQNWNANGTDKILFVIRHTSAANAITSGTTANFAVVDQIGNVGSNTPGSLVGGSAWPLEGESDMGEIDIKVDSIPITAATKKLKAKWTPELGQDLNAYHNLDAEVELTSILSEQIALEIDREILGDLVNGATAGTYYWSRSPGLFVNRETGAELGATSAAPDFTGTVSEWYETLIETINDVSAQIHRKTLRGGANFIVCSPEVANILEFTSGFRANVTADADKGTIGAVKAGSLSRKFDVMVDPYFPRAAILVGRKGSSFLESGYVYAPYVPLQTTPTIFGPEDFVPRKGVMTRYGKKMVRPDMYGLVIVRGMLGESGS
jgi:hypothetical protein